MDIQQHQLIEHGLTRMFLDFQTSILMEISTVISHNVLGFENLAMGAFDFPQCFWTFQWHSGWTSIPHNVFGLEGPPYEWTLFPTMFWTFQ